VRRIAFAAVAALLLSACGGSSPQRRDVAVVRVVTSGGFAAESRQPAQLPQLSVFGDGRVITIGPTTLEYPGPALPNLQEFRLTRTGLAHVIDGARDAGLLDDPPPDFGDPGVTDQSTTTVTVSVGERTRRVNVYAPGFSDGLTLDQRENRSRLDRFIQLAADPDALLPFVVPDSERRYDPVAVAALVRPSDAADGDTHVWPLDDLAGTDCVVLNGSDATTALDAARSARQGDPWISGNVTYRLAFRPLLPDERTCDDVLSAH
jgi:hypothetical protein